MTHIWARVEANCKRALVKCCTCESRPRGYLHHRRVSTRDFNRLLHFTGSRAKHVRARFGFCIFLFFSPLVWIITLDTVGWFLVRGGGASLRSGFNSFKLRIYLSARVSPWWRLRFNRVEHQRVMIIARGPLWSQFRALKMLIHTWIFFFSINSNREDDIGVVSVKSSAMKISCRSWAIRWNTHFRPLQLLAARRVYRNFSHVERFRERRLNLVIEVVVPPHWRTSCTKTIRPHPLFRTSTPPLWSQTRM